VTPLEGTDHFVSSERLGTCGRPGFPPAAAMCNVMRMADGEHDVSFPTASVMAWARLRWRWLLVVALILFAIWRFSGKRPEEVGRYVLVKDDIPCQTQRPDDDGRKWCYLVLDTKSGRLEERVRKVGGKRK
jgi:hypothetical protein